VIRAGGQIAILKYKWKVIGYPDGFDGLIWPEKSYELKLNDVSGDSSARSARFLGQLNRGNPFKYCTIENGQESFRGYLQEVIGNSRNWGLTPSSASARGLAGPLPSSFPKRH